MRVLQIVRKSISLENARLRHIAEERRRDVATVRGAVRRVARSVVAQDWRCRYEVTRSPNFDRGARSDGRGYTSHSSVSLHGNADHVPLAVNGLDDARGAGIIA